MSTSKSEQTREAFLDVAIREACLCGIARLTLAPLAAAAGRSKGGLLRYFPSKESLQIAVIEHTFSRFKQHVLEPARLHPPGLARLRAALDHWISWMDRAGLKGGCPLLAAQHEFDDEGNAASDTLRAGTEQWNGYLRHQARIARENGQLPPGLEPDALVMLMFGLVSAAQLERGLLRRKDANIRALRAFDQLARI